ncbi:hypothetical protein SCB71_06250 [Herbiconiux sp. KACC 21604]|uniref:hypothetical protein n=1 Tax=unclassified Herbiconiux TaxID=2618217 RepID=UPI0014926104|nr:hypothetical protein [Herbiconiux sp. SALV-R1]QJU52919.1 hypothetical protein HL652_04235 [Herbiconiux sp. SALV-R1]WPO87839.1 hypothetical protein SCB71_06250 [Herbiconiux sp. KACC 21604]
MSLVDGLDLIEWSGCLFDPLNDDSMELLARCMAIEANMTLERASIYWNEAGRPYGVESDRYARRASDTFSGRSTVWYQWGRAERGETPSAADPRMGPLASQHTRGRAMDCNAPNDYSMQRRAYWMGLAGMKRTIPSESWHFELWGACQLDLTPYRIAIDMLVHPDDYTNARPLEEEETMDKYCLVARVDWDTKEAFNKDIRTGKSNVFLINLAEGTYRWLPTDEAIHLHTKPKEEGGFGIPYRDGTFSAQILIGLTNIFNKAQWSGAVA